MLIKFGIFRKAEFYKFSIFLGNLSHLGPGQSRVFCTLGGSCIVCSMFQTMTNSWTMTSDCVLAYAVT